MAVYVDEIVDYGGMVNGEARRYGTNWCHLLADTEEELHEFARRIGLKRRWFQNHSIAHYDMVPSRRVRAVAAGAKELTTMDILRLKRRREEAR